MRLLSMFGFVLLAAASLASGQATQPATQPTSQPDDASLTHLIEQLGSADFSERESAQARLAEMDSSALPALRDAAEVSSDPEVRGRAASAAQAIWDRQRFGVTRVTIVGQDIHPREAFNQLIDQSGVDPSTIVVNDAFWEQASMKHVPAINLRDVTFWEAAIDLQRMTGIRIQPNGESFTLIPNNPGVEGMIAQGPVLVMLQTASTTRTADYRNGGIIREQTYLTMQLLPEPKLSRAAGRPSWSELDAFDDQGRELDTGRGRNLSSVNASGAVLTARIGLALSQEGERAREVNLKSVLLLPVAQSEEAVVFEDLAEAVGESMSVGSGNSRYTVTVMAMDPEPNRRQIKTTLRVETPASADPNWVSTIHSRGNGLRLTDAAGRDLQPAGVSMKRRQDNLTEIEFTYRGRDDRGGITDIEMPVQLRWNFVTASKELQVPIEINDLKLP